jgi:hypothetical protein
MTALDISPDFLTLAKVLADDLASEIDLHYEDNELPEATEAILKLQTLQSFVSTEPSETVAHIIGRYERAVVAATNGG